MGNQGQGQLRKQLTVTQLQMVCLTSESLQGVSTLTLLLEQLGPGEVRPDLTDSASSFIAHLLEKEAERKVKVQPLLNKPRGVSPTACPPQSCFGIDTSVLASLNLHPVLQSEPRVFPMMSKTSWRLCSVCLPSCSLDAHSPPLDLRPLEGRRRQALGT